MKKAVSLILSAALMFFSSFFAYAYYFSTGNIATPCTVSAKKGCTFIADYADGRAHDHALCEELTLKYKTEVTLDGEATDPELLTENGYKTDGILYAHITARDNEDNERTGYVNIKDLAPVKKSVGISEGVKTTYPVKFHVIAEEGVKIYAGPSRVYEELGQIPCGGEFETNYIDSYEYYSYAYTEYNNIKGWVYIYPYTGKAPLANIIDENSYYTGKLTVVKEGQELTDLNEIINDSYKVTSEKIPAGTELKFDYYVDMGATYAALTEYGGSKGWLYFEENYDEPEDYNCICYVRDVGYIGEKMPFCSDFDMKKEEGTVPAGTKVNINAIYIDALEEFDAEENSGYNVKLLIEYGGSEYWIQTGGTANVTMCSGRYSQLDSIGTTADMYANTDKESEIVGQVTPDNDFRVFMTTTRKNVNWLYVYNNGKWGWIIDNEDYNWVGQTAITALRLNDDGSVSVGMEVNFSDEEFDKKEFEPEVITQSTAPEPTKKEKNPPSFTKIITMIAVPAALIAAGAVAGIAIYIKKRDKQDEEKYNKI